MNASTKAVLRFRFNPLSKRTIIRPSAQRSETFTFSKVKNSRPNLYISSRPNMLSAIIPARNEEDAIARAVESVAVQPEIREVIVVNDQSTDGTAAILTELTTRIPKLKDSQCMTVCQMVGSARITPFRWSVRSPRANGFFSPTPTPITCSGRPAGR